MSLLLAEGHTDARNYPIYRIGYEAHIVNERLNRLTTTNAILTQSAIGSCLSKEGNKSFNDLVKNLNG